MKESGGIALRLIKKQAVFLLCSGALVGIYQLVKLYFLVFVLEGPAITIHILIFYSIF